MCMWRIGSDRIKIRWHLKMTAECMLFICLYSWIVCSLSKVYRTLVLLNYLKKFRAPSRTKWFAYTQKHTSTHTHFSLISIGPYRFAAKFYDVLKDGCTFFSNIILSQNRYFYACFQFEQEKKKKWEKTLNQKHNNMANSEM